MASFATNPKVVAIAGPNGAGKTTITPRLLRSVDVLEWVNADVIARGLSGLQPESAAWEASRVMLQRLRKLTEERANFAFETTLAARSYASMIRDLVAQQYEFHLFYVVVPSDDTAVERVKHRVLSGGHHVPEEDVRRRFKASIRNFFELYRPLAYRWTVYDNSLSSGPSLVARGAGEKAQIVVERTVWSRLLEYAK
jgi:predicted ABC-type ATPase